LKIRSWVFPNTQLQLFLVRYVFSFYRFGTFWYRISGKHLV
jgi:hypothetical protein